MDGTKRTKRWQEALINQDDFMREMINKICQEVLEADFDKFIGAQAYERTDSRKGYRNGHYTRQLSTRVGALTLAVCRDREGEFQPELFDRYQRSEKALMLVIAEMYFTGVSTRKVNHIMQELSGISISKSQVSRLVCQLDHDLQEWRERPLNISYRYLVIDARYEKVRENGSVISKAVVVVIGITHEGIREVIGCWVVNSESYEAWDDCFKGLKERGLTGVEYVVTDDNKGLRKALGKYFQEVKQQRCQVHFMRNLIDKLAKVDQPLTIRLMQDVFAAETKEDAMARLQKVYAFLLSKRKESVVQWLEENVEETLTVVELPPEHRKKMKSTNMLERLNQELKRRSRVVRIFPNADSCLRLSSAICQEISESWGNRKYIDMHV